jgi:choline dehydrogenase-like flavoprotein
VFKQSKLGHQAGLGIVEGRLMLFRNVVHLVESGFRPRVCIVGTGPAGMSLALRLQERKIPCLLIEAGGYDSSESSQDFYRGEVVGDPYYKLHEARLRQFGGSSGHWSGWVSALDASDFEVRPYMPHSGWPIRKADLDPYAAAADEILQVKPTVNDRPLTPDIDAIHYRFSPPVRFGTKYRANVEQSTTIGLLLNTAAKELVPGNGRIASIKVVDGTRQERDLPVDQVCVCTGGIENSRLLLWSNARYGRRVVPSADALGRYWMEHPLHDIADAVTFHGYEMQFESWSPEKWFFAPSDFAKKMHAIGGAHIWMRAYSPNLNRAKELWRQAMCVAPDLSNRLLKLANKEYHCGALIRTEFEQVPIPENRIELDRQTDALGVPRARLYWKKSDTERKSALVAARLLGEALIKHDIGRLRIRNFLIDGTDYPRNGNMAGFHHMGGTRMAESPANGVVDRNCRVFGMANLYVGGSSVFATGGHASPTYSIVQLALRLGDHLAARLGRG